MTLLACIFPSPLSSFQFWSFTSKPRSKALSSCMVFCELCKVICEFLGLVFAKGETWWPMFLSLLNSMVTLQAKCLGFHFVNMFYPLFTIQLSWFFFAWFFQNCKRMLTWFDFWFLKMPISWVEFSQKCLDFLVKFDFQLFVQPSPKKLSNTCIHKNIDHLNHYNLTQVNEKKIGLISWKTLYATTE